MKLFRIFLCAVITFSISFTAFYGANRIGVTPDAVKPTEYKGIITLWHIDSFEGGRGSRKQFLLDVATSFEKQNKGALVMVVSHTKESAEDSLKNGILPDLISFGGGVDVNNPVQCCFFRTFKGGIIDKTEYFVPWCRGGYVLITNPKLVPEYKGEKIDNLLVSQNTYTQPLIATLEENITADQITALSPMDAYVKFTNGKTPYLLGTQRDVCRLINRGMDFNVTPLTKFNDLYQYIGVLSNDALKTAYSEKFINFLLDDKIQAKLNKISMFSVFSDVDYDESALKKMQNVAQEKTLSVFTSSVELKNLQALGLSAMQGDDGAKIKIKNILI